ncbi:low molecular weight phosphatase family protein [Micromonospora sp. NPDC000089]|uniref:arsenate reductase/protein-tyrosine-phosphatase family protein n=1 Tax=unclassified Micromonospora TaxID=2617518 RepID=UPI0036B6FBE4
MPDRLLIVCHANMCRSPMAEYLLRQLLGDRPIVVASAGTHAVPGHPMHPYAAEIAAGTGADPAAFVSRELRPEHLAEADLVLTATRRQRSICTALAPAALHRTFTLHQFGRLAAAADPPAGRVDAPLRTAVRAAARARALLQPAAPEADDLRDPIGGGPEDFRRCAAEIGRSVRPVLTLIGAAG